MKRTKKPLKPDFSDDAKRRAGIEVSDYAKESARLKREYDGIVALKDARIATLEEAVQRALLASDEGRRGDCARILRGVLPRRPTSPAPTTPPEPRSA